MFFYLQKYHVKHTPLAGNKHMETKVPNWAGTSVKAYLENKLVYENKTLTEYLN